MADVSAFVINRFEMSPLPMIGFLDGTAPPVLASGRQECGHAGTDHDVQCTRTYLVCTQTLLSLMAQVGNLSSSPILTGIMLACCFLFFWLQLTKTHYVHPRV
ncbi:hypothetical protein LZ32DRAFT_338356 [Colletotrichum eremochloae]|nr:hypothetical protein LZ32DRAFT_338356 [Colletotrichum eremochloae]